MESEEATNFRGDTERSTQSSIMLELICILAALLDNNAYLLT